MAADMAALRRKAAFAVARDLGRHEIRSLFEAGGYRSDEDIVVALETDTVADVFSRIRRHDPPVAVAIYWPETGRLEYTSFKPSEEVSSFGGVQEQVGGTATIGMLFEHTDRQKHGQYRFNLTWDQPTMNIKRFEVSSA
ncbi:hypothetical protein [Streptomyces sp. MA25(2023)]|uniref:hypothetical protein n=1 Tax=Streptomyces sp. MA25(2023) TaxID=3055078 RepID=UPI0025B17099|nr:hypothetical protein [Streptomyces sp. MA25(2023)]MDN3255670.1 hypothetical protein [Streptomyces sp. MA25(2023)]